MGSAFKFSICSLSACELNNEFITVMVPKVGNTLKSSAPSYKKLSADGSVVDIPTKIEKYKAI